MNGLDIRLPWFWNRADAKILNNIQSSDRPIAGLVDYNAAENRYFVNPNRISWWEWLGQELTFRQLLISWPFIQGRVLEIGLGNKPFWLFFHHLSSRYIAFDFSAAFTQSGVPPVQFHPLYLPLKPESLDTIVVRKIVRFLENPRQFLTQLHAGLRPDGRLILLVSHEKQPDAPLPILCDFTPMGYRQLLLSIGFQVELARSFSGEGLSRIQKWNAWAGRQAILKNSPRFVKQWFLLMENAWLTFWQKKNLNTREENLPPNPVASLFVARKI